MKVLQEFYRFKLVETETIVGKREYIKHPGAVSIIALNDQNEILIERNLRVGIDKILVELPSGLVEENEERLITAKRELLEETGYVANKWDELYTFYNSAGILDETTTIFLARNLAFVGKNLDKEEKSTQISQEFISEEALFQLIMSGEEEIDAKVPMAALGLSKVLVRR